MTTMDFKVSEESTDNGLLTVSAPYLNKDSTSDHVHVEKWHKAAGRWVEKGEVVVEIETHPNTLIEVRAPESGVIVERFYNTHDEARVGSVLFSIDTDARPYTRHYQEHLEAANYEAWAEEARRQGRPYDPPQVPETRKQGAEPGRADPSRAGGDNNTETTPRYHALGNEPPSASDREQVREMSERGKIPGMGAQIGGEPRFESEVEAEEKQKERERIREKEKWNDIPEEERKNPNIRAEAERKYRNKDQLEWEMGHMTTTTPSNNAGQPTGPP